MTFSTTTLQTSNSFSAQVTTPSDDGITSTLGFGADTAAEISEPIAGGLKQSANDFGFAASQLDTAGHLIGGDFGRSLNQIAGDVADHASGLAQTGETVEKLGSTMKGLGNVMTVIDAGDAAKKGFSESNEPSLGGKIANGAIAAGSKVAAAATWELGAVDFATHGEFSNLLKAGGNAILGLGELAAGDTQAPARFRQEVDAGHMGKVAQGVEYATDQMASGVAWLINRVQGK